MAAHLDELQEVQERMRKLRQGRAKHRDTAELIKAVDENRYALLRVRDALHAGNREFASDALAILSEVMAELSKMTSGGAP